jgi:integrase
MKLDLKNLNWSTKRRRDGSIVKYWYAWRGGPRLTGKPGSAEFVQSYNDAIASRKADRRSTGLLSFVLDKYLDSMAFRTRAQRTRKDYRRQIDLIRGKFGSLPLDTLGSQKARRFLFDWREELGKRSLRQADYAWTVLALVLAWGKEAGYVDHNPCERGRRFYQGTRVDKIWSTALEKEFYARAPGDLAEAMLLAIWTGQRQGDLLGLTWFQYDGKAIRLQQNKTEARVAVPVAGPLRAMLDRKMAALMPKPGDPILTNSKGKAWTSEGFQSSWSKACARLGIEGLTFNDLRGTAVTRLALAGCSVPEIASLTGHSLKDVHTILDAHYLHRDPGLAAAAIVKMESFWAGPGPETANEAGTVFQTASQTGSDVLMENIQKAN